MAMRKVRFTIGDMTGEKCVSRVENTLKDLRGVLDVRAKLLEKNLGEAEVLYRPDEVGLENLKKAVHTAGGERHNFMVIGASEDS